MLRIHFLNVGHGDCTVIEHPSGRVTVVDINNAVSLDVDSHREISTSLRPLPSLGALGLGGPGFAPRQAALLTGDIGLAGLAPATPSPRAVGLGASLRGLGLSGVQASRRDIPGYDIKLMDPLDFLLRRGCREIFRYIQTHPDLDHMRGLAALASSGIEIANFWDTFHTKVPDFRSDEDRVDWQAYRRLRRGGNGVTVLNLYRGDRGCFWNSDLAGGEGDGIEILSPTRQLVASAVNAEKWNNLSYVLRIRYAGISVILGGDAESEAWDDIARTYGSALRCDVLKASHHGRDSGYHAGAVALMKPKYVIVSVGKKPETDASNKYCQVGLRGAAQRKVWSTRWKGTITLTISRDGRGNLESEYAR